MKKRKIIIIAIVVGILLAITGTIFYISYLKVDSDKKLEQTQETFVKIPTKVEEPTVDSSVTEFLEDVRPSDQQNTIDEMEKSWQDRDYSVMYLTYGQTIYYANQSENLEGYKLEKIDVDEDAQVVKLNFKQTERGASKDALNTFVDGELFKLLSISPVASFQWYTGLSSIQVIV